MNINRIKTILMQNRIAYIKICKTFFRVLRVHVDEAHLKLKDRNRE